MFKVGDKVKVTQAGWDFDAVPRKFNDINKIYTITSISGAVATLSGVMYEVYGSVAWGIYNHNIKKAGSVKMRRKAV